MKFTITCNNCGCTDVDIDIFTEKMVLTCNGCDEIQIVVMAEEL